MSDSTGVRIFFNYAWPCAEIMLAQGEIAERQYGLLKYFRDNLHRQPGRRLLVECFPDATRSLLESATIFRASDPWALEHVREYWRYHHEGPSPTTVLTVESMGVDRIWVRENDGHTGILLNPYSLHVESGDRVTVHHRCAIEKL